METGAIAGDDVLASMAEYSGPTYEGQLNALVSMSDAAAESLTIL